MDNHSASVNTGPATTGKKTNMSAVAKAAGGAVDSKPGKK